MRVFFQVHTACHLQSGDLALVGLSPRSSDFVLSNSNLNVDTYINIYFCRSVYLST